MRGFKILSMFFLISVYPNCGMMSPEEDSKTNDKQTLETQYVAQEEKVVEVDSSISIEYLMGKFDPRKHADFTKVDSKFASRSDFVLRKDTYTAFQKILFCTHSILA